MLLLWQARLFFHHPKFGILDECTNATSVDVEESLYKRAQALGIAVVTISQVCSNLVYFTVGFCFGVRTYSTFGTFTEHLVWD
jgi:ABC-type uncharacterized transport system fused permease/ATPase subunit